MTFYRTLGYDFGGKIPLVEVRADKTTVPLRDGGNRTRKMNRLSLSPADLISAIIASALLNMSAGDVRAQTTKSQTARSFLGVTLTPGAREYLVLKDVNVRKAPVTESSRAGRYKKGVRVQSAGKAKGTEWVAVRQDGKDLGFIYGTALTAILNGRLKAPIRGNLTNPGRPPCHYVIRFDSRNKIEGELQVTSDYQVPMQCDYKNKAVKFTANMFVTELPYLDLKKDIYQINVDILGISGVEDELFSVIALYQPSKNRLNFDSVNVPALATRKKFEPVSVTSLPLALTGAINLAHVVWSDKIWDELAEGQ